MNPIDLVKYSLKNAVRRKGRALLTVVAVFIGAFTFTVTSGLGAGVNSYLETQTSSLGAENTVHVTASASTALLSERLDKYDPDLTSAVAGTSAGILSEDDIAKIRSAVGDARVITTTQTNPQYIQKINGDRYRFVYNGYWPEKKVSLLAGEQLDDRPGSEPELILPSYAVEPLGFEDAAAAVGQPVLVGVLDVTGTIHEIRARVSGVQERSLIGGNLPFGNESFDRLLQDFSANGAQSHSALWYPYALVVSDDVSETVEALRAEGFSAATAAQTVGDYRSIMNGVLLLLNLLASVAIGAAMFGIVNTLLMSVQERTRSIGLFRALGLSKAQVFTSVALEASVLGLLGSVLAVGVGVLAGMTGGPLLLEAAALSLPGLVLFQFNVGGIASIIIGVMLATVLAAALPAARASRLEPMDALREEH
ncbi:ABC transporter permease [Arthrobacter sp. ISL-69]|uniref:ABC transporter permease n=1 Tax=Arthrobacter sp. ISL-69 TaxID=2819113 RepID=UPI001BE73585|nr:ABC transporter permease [Arthrobacter sp. ISL-69]MBT2536259.1 ABC transporter permease [Arthrobacter sp. ISL-69]